MPPTLFPHPTGQRWLCLAQTMWDEHKMLFKALVDAEPAKGAGAEPAVEDGDA